MTALPIATDDRTAEPNGGTEKSVEKVKIINRLRRLEGQIRGLQRMIEDEQTCVEVMTQFASAKSALDATGDVILETYVAVCMARDNEPKDLVKLLKLAR